MTWEIILVLALLVGALVLFVREVVPADVTALILFSILLLLSILPVQSSFPTTTQLLSVLANAAPLTVLAMFMLSAALTKTGAMDSMAGLLTWLGRGGPWGILLATMVVAAPISAFINNTPVVVIFTPVVLAICRQLQVPPSRMLIPLSFATVLGGCCTLLGTSTNIVVSGLLERAGQPALGMFELAWVGVPITLLGIVYLMVAAPRLLPERQTLSSMLAEEDRREYLTEAFVHPGSNAIGKTLGQSGLLKARGVRVLEIVRDGVAVQEDLKKTVLREGDRLMVAARPIGFARVQGTGAVEWKEAAALGLETIAASEGAIVEGIVGPKSSLLGLTTKEINLRQRFRVSLLAVHRHGQNLREQVDTLPLQFGDTLLLMGTNDAIARLRASDDILLLDRPRTPAKTEPWKMFASIGMVAAVVLLAVFEVPIVAAAIVAITVLLGLRCLTPREAYASVEWNVLTIIYGTMALGLAMETTGAARLIAGALVQGAEMAAPVEARPLLMLGLLYLLTMVVTELLSNNAAAVLLAPLALGVAATLGVDPRPFIIGVCIAASASFATPIGYQTNTYVYGVGGYKFTDFTRIGLPLNFLCWGTAMFVIPQVWPF